MDMNTLLIILTTAIVLVTGGVLAYVFYFQQRTKRLKSEFGSEYSHAVEEAGSRRKAEDELENRQERVEAVHIRALDADERDYFLKQWQKIQADFVNDPRQEVEEADRLITEVMLARGYPMTQFDRRVDDLSVNYPEVVNHYRQAHAIANKDESQTSTEELRQAVLNYRTLFDDLLEMQASSKPEMAMAE